MRGSRRLLVAAALGVWLLSTPVQFAAPSAGLPDRLANREFWRLSAAFSETPGFFNSDNLVSNEDTYQHVIPELTRRVRPGGAYIGVGPEQNFTYIAALDPAVAFIADLRRGNLQLHLIYKALFGLAPDRRQFLARLFGRRVSEQVPAGAPLADLMAAVYGAAADGAFHEANLRDVLVYLERHRGQPLDEGDRAGIEFILSRFFADGPDLTFVSNSGFRRSRYPTYAQLQAATDLAGTERAYLATEAGFQRVKSLQQRNLVIPVVGNFAGTKALPSIGTWVAGQGGVVTAFYTSNVEQYLFQEGAWDRFRQNVALLPTDATSTVIRSCFSSCTPPGGSRAISLLDEVGAMLEAAAAGQVATYWDLLRRSWVPDR